MLPTNPANRIPLLTANKVDLVLANFTITDERAKQVDFSIPYFSSGQQFIAKKGVLKSADQLNGLRVGVDKGTVNEGALREKFPGAKVIAYDDTPFAFTALRNGQVQAITQDGPKLIGLLANVPDKRQVRSPALHHLQRPDRRGHPQGRDAPDGLRQRHAQGAGGERHRPDHLRHLVRSDHQDAAGAHLQDRRQELSGSRRNGSKPR